MSNNKFDSDYLKWLQQIEVSGAEPIWEKIEDQLDLIESWEKIHAKLDIIQAEKKSIVISLKKVMEIAAAIAFLILIPLMIYLIQQNNRTSIPANNLITEVPSHKAIPDNEEIADLNSKLINSQEEKPPELFSAGKTIPPEEESSSHKEILSPFAESIKSPMEKSLSNEKTELHSDEQSLNEKTLYSPEEILSPAIITHPDSHETSVSDERIIYPSDKIADFPSGIDPLSPGELTGSSEISRTEKPDKLPGMPEIKETKQLLAEINSILEKAYDEIPEIIASTNTSAAFSKKSSASFLRFNNIGLVYSFKNTWLLNYETLNGLNPAKLGNTLPTFHHDMGLTTTLTFKEKHNIGMDFMWISETGQNYQQYIDASYVNRSITLNYFKVQTWYIWNHRKFPGNMITGAYFGRLAMAEDIRGDIKLNVKDDYRNYDYGLIMGYQLNFALFNNITICPGVRFNLNLINIFEGQDGTINIFKTTNNFTSGINIAFNYSF